MTVNDAHGDKHMSQQTQAQEVRDWLMLTLRVWVVLVSAVGILAVAAVLLDWSAAAHLVRTSMLLGVLMMVMPGMLQVLARIGSRDGSFPFAIVLGALVAIVPILLTRL